MQMFVFSFARASRKFSGHSVLIFQFFQTSIQSRDNPDNFCDLRRGETKWEDEYMTEKSDRTKSENIARRTSKGKLLKSNIL
jgi:hypothetical protein